MTDGPAAACGPDQIVVAGAGLAGLRTIEELRQRGYGGQVTLVGAESRLPYDRPPLSKKVMAGELDDTTLREDLDSLGVTARLGQRATGLRLTGADGPAQNGVLATDGGDLPFGALVVATGASPVTLPGEGRQHVLRTLDDALALRDLLLPGTALAIVGAGWIGAELATVAAGRGCRVTVVEAAPAPLAGALGPELGACTAPWYPAAGVDLRLGQGVTAVQDGGLALAGGGWLAADVVVTAVGVRPAVSWLADSGLALNNGVAVDGGLRASRPGVFAVGDCAAFASARYGRRLRVEHWDGALHGPATVAANVLGGAETYDPVPYFWSEQFGRMVQYAGFHGQADRLVWRGDPADARWAVAWLRPDGLVSDGLISDGPAGNRLVAMLTVGQPRDLTQARRAIGAGAAVDPAGLADPAVPVRDCVLA